MVGLGKSLIYLGIIIVVVGLVLTYGGRIPWLGQLPGDIYIRRENFTFYFPLTTGLIISVILSLVLYFFRR
jgi:hypothetical protein